MKKTLLVSFLPREERSKTKRLLDTFKKIVEGKTEIEELDLIQNIPDMFVQGNTLAYYKKYYANEIISEEKEKLLSKMVRMTQQAKNADYIVLAYPMYNFSLPAIVKAWFDSIMLKGETWDITDTGYTGLMQGKKALILSTSGGVYNTEMKNASWNHSLPLGKQEFQFMSFDEVEAISASGMNMYGKEKIEEILQQSINDIQALVNKWYT